MSFAQPTLGCPGVLEIKRILPIILHTPTSYLLILMLHYLLLYTSYCLRPLKQGEPPNFERAEQLLKKRPRCLPHLLYITPEYPMHKTLPL